MLVTWQWSIWDQQPHVRPSPINFLTSRTPIQSQRSSKSDEKHQRYGGALNAPSHQNFMILDPIRLRVKVLVTDRQTEWQKMLVRLCYPPFLILGIIFFSTAGSNISANNIGRSLTSCWRLCLDGVCTRSKPTYTELWWRVKKDWGEKIYHEIFYAA